MHICLPIKIKSATENDNDINAGTITVNNFFAHWVKEIDFERFKDDIPLLQIFL